MAHTSDGLALSTNAGFSRVYEQLGKTTIDNADLSDIAFRFALNARQMASMSELEDALQKCLRPLEITGAASGYITGPRSHSANPFHFIHWPKEWIDLYIAEEFLLNDPLPRWARGSGYAITWQDLFRLLPKRDPGRRVITAAGIAGFREGLAIPMRSLDNALGLVSFGGNRDALSDFEQVYLSIIGRATFEAADRITDDGKAGKIAPSLSAREIECLVLLARGHSDRQIGDLIGLSEATVRYHLGNARAKTGALSRTHLAAVAISAGYISI